MTRRSRSKAAPPSSLAVGFRQWASCRRARCSSSPGSRARARIGPFNTATSMPTTDEGSLVLLEALLASAPVGIAFLDGDLRVARINKALADVLGYSVEDCQGRLARDLSPPGMWPVVEFALRQVAETGEPIHDYEFSGPHAHRDERRYWSASVFPVRV